MGNKPSFASLIARYNGVLPTLTSGQPTELQVSQDGHLLIELPPDAATATNQLIEIASLASIDAGIPVALGQTIMAASMPVVIASNQSLISVQGADVEGVANPTTNPFRIAGEAIGTQFVTPALCDSQGRFVIGGSVPIGTSFGAGAYPLHIGVRGFALGENTIPTSFTSDGYDILGVSGAIAEGNLWDGNPLVAGMIDDLGNVVGIRGDTAGVKIQGSVGNNATPSNPVLISGYDYTIGLQRNLRVSSQGRAIVDVNSSALPTGAATSTNQTVQTTILNDIEADLSSIDAKLVTPVALADDTANPTVPGVGAFLMGWDVVNSNWDRIQTAVPTLDGVNGAVFPGILTTNLGYYFNGVNFDRIRGNTLGAFIQGNVANDAADGAGNPVKVGGRATNIIPTAVANNDRTHFYADLVGRQLVKPLNSRALTGLQTTTITNSAAETTIISAVASEAHDIVALILTQTAGLVAPNLTFKDSTGGTTRFVVSVPLGATIVIAIPNLAIPQPAGANQNWTCTLSSAAVTVSIMALYSKESTSA